MDDDGSLISDRAISQECHCAVRVAYWNICIMHDDEFVMNVAVDQDKAADFIAL